MHIIYNQDRVLNKKKRKLSTNTSYRNIFYKVT